MCVCILDKSSDFFLDPIYIMLVFLLCCCFTMCVLYKLNFNFTFNSDCTILSFKNIITFLIFQNIFFFQVNHQNLGEK